jgi:hypothetical protein
VQVPTAVLAYAESVDLLVGFAGECLKLAVRGGLETNPDKSMFPSYNRFAAGRGSRARTRGGSAFASD